MNFNKCKYSKCKKLLYLSDEPVNGCCCIDHAKLAKHEYNVAYYKKTKLNSQIVKHANIFKACLDQFGEEEFDAYFLQLLKIDWDLQTHKVVIKGEEYIAIGHYAYLLSKSKKVKIKRL